MRPGSVRGAATDAAFHLVRRDGGPGLRRLLDGAIPQWWFDRHQAWRSTHGLTPWEPTRLYHLRATPDDVIGVDVRTSAVAQRLLAGPREHRSQAHVLMPVGVDDATFLRGSTHEAHVVAWPPRRPGDAVLGDVFDGLD